MPRAGRRTAYVILGMALVKQGRTEDALAAWEKAEQIDPDDVALASHMGSLYDEQYQLTENPAYFELAQKYYLKSMRSILLYSETGYVNLGVLYALNGEVEKGIRVWEEGLRKFPHSSLLKHNLAYARQ